MLRGRAGVVPAVMVMGVIVVVLTMPMVVMVLVVIVRRFADRIRPALGRERSIDRPHLAAG
jgi:hypothetical protein